jgi:iron(III) transport system substrate-binding protein
VSRHGRLPRPLRPLRPLVAAATLAVAATGLAACGGSGDDALTIYSGRTEELVKPLLDRFAQDTGIDIAVRYGDSADLAVLIDTEGDQSPADVFLSQSPGAIGFLDSKDRLTELPAEALERVPERFHATDGDWVGVSGRVRVIVFDADRTDAADVPDSVFDLTDERYRGKVGIAPNNGSFQDFVTIMRSLEGDDATLDWLTAMRENGVRTYDNNIAIRDAVQRGEIEFGLVNHYYNEQAKAEDPGTTTENHFLAGGDPGAAILTAAAGVLDTAGDRAADARRFVEYLLEHDAQEYFTTATFEYPLVAGIEPASDLPDLDSLPAPQVDLSQLGGGLQRTRELIRDSGLESA